MWITKQFGHCTEFRGTHSEMSVYINVDGNDIEERKKALLALE